MVRQSFVSIVSLAAVVAFASLATPIAATAQESSPSAVASFSAPAAVAPAPVVGPVHAPAGIVRAEVTEAEALYLQNPGSGNRNVMWMIVGGGLLVGGMIIGDDVGTILSVTGLVIGLVGVYRYLR